MDNNLDIIAKNLKMQAEEKMILQQLLDRQRTMQDHVLAVKAKMGITLSFVTSVPMKWIAANVRFAKQLPVWENKNLDEETGNIKINVDTIEELRQREPDWRRQIPMVRYMIQHQHHKFPPLLVTSWQDWVNLKGSDEWINGEASKNSITEMSLDSSGSYIDLNCENTNFYALDGQHRLMAIKGLQTLLSDEVLVAKDKNGNPLTRKSIRLDEFTENMPNTQKIMLQNIMNESLGIEIIPSVLMGETYEQSVKRLRTIFVHVNKSASRLTKGELALLDEDNGYAIVARRAMVKHKMLKYKRVQAKQGQLREDAFEYTTLETLVAMVKLYLNQTYAESNHWGSPSKDELPERPDETELESGEQKFMELFSFLATLPSHLELINERKKPAGYYRTNKEDENILFRPIAQEALAEALGYLKSKDHDLEQVLVTLVQHEKNGDLRLRDPKSIWYGVLCEVTGNNIMRKKESYKKLCAKLLMYFLGRVTTPEERISLGQDVREARIIDQAKNIYVGLDGEHKTTPLDLPPPWL